MKEIWKDIKNYEGLYQISNFGRVKSLERKVYNLKNNKFNRKAKEKILKLTTNNKGYLNVGLSKGKKQKIYKVHRLVAQTFISNLENKPQVNHKDGNKKNNNINNLEWVSNLENIRHAWNNKLRDNNTVCHKNNYDKRLTKIEQYSLNDKFLKKWECISDITKKYGFNHSNIVACCNNRKLSAYGYKWKYIKL